MKIQTFCLANNEEMLMPYFMRHYSQFSDVILLESNSTDRTVEIATEAGAEVWSYDRKDEIDDRWFLEVKNNCWKESKADWVIICDADEFVYHPNIVKILEQTDATIFIPRLFNMFSETFPTTTGQIYDEVKGGREGGGKMNLFRPSEIKEINYDPGCHSAKPTGNVKLNVSSEILTLHYRFIGKDFVVARNQRAAGRRSMINKQMGWGYHVTGPPEDVIKYMDDEMTDLIKVV